MWQPGTYVNYGQGFEWLAVEIERTIKTDLASHLQENIFDPLELKDIGFEEVYGGDITTRDESKGRFYPAASSKQMEALSSSTRQSWKRCPGQKHTQRASTTRTPSAQVSSPAPRPTPAS